MACVWVAGHSSIEGVGRRQAAQGDEEIVDPEPTSQTEQIRNSVDMTGISYWNQDQVLCVHVGMYVC